MPQFLQPDPVLLAFLGFKQGLYLEILILFAALRALLARDRARWAALSALVLSILFVAAKWLPPVLGQSSGPLFLLGGWVRGSLGGMSAPLLCSVLLLAAAILRGRRFWGVDLLHLLWFGALLGLWGYTIWA